MSPSRSCIECGYNISDGSRLDRFYCSQICRLRAKYRRRYQRNPDKYAFKQKLWYARKRPTNRCCRTCGANISWRRGNAQYCSTECQNTAKLARDARQREVNRTRLRLCRKCGDTIPFPRRFVCDRCLRPRESGWRKWIRNPPTIDEKMRRKARTRLAVKKHRAKVLAAYAVYRELQGATKAQPKPSLPPPTCVVCGIMLTGFRKRILCGHPSCKQARERERWLSYYAGVPYSATPRMIAAAGQKGNGKFRDIKKDRRRRRLRSRTERSRREYAAYLAMKELNLIPTQEDDQ
jgi:hypothetical protein